MQKKKEKKKKKSFPPPSTPPSVTGKIQRMALLRGAITLAKTALEKSSTDITY